MFEVKNSFDQRIRDNRRISVDKIASEMSTSRGVWLKVQLKTFYRDEMRICTFC